MTYSKMDESDWKYAQPPLNREGELQVSDNPAHTIHWEEYGNPKGEPVMVVHGGPGGACDEIYARFFDPERYRVILFDQRGCGKSSPNASDDNPIPALTDNTTQDLISDMNKLRDELGINGKMHLFGGSWGSTLSLTYATEHPENVQSMTLRGIFLGRREDLDFLYQGNAENYDEKPFDTTKPGAYQHFPEAWKALVEVIPPEKRGDMVKAYAEIFAGEPQTEEERQYQDRAATAWSVWEGSISYLSQDLSDLSKYEDPEFARAFAKIENHYFMNGCFLGGEGETNRDQNYLLEHLDALKDIPTQIVHGRYDVVCPMNQAEALVAGLKEVGAPILRYELTPAGHSMMERDTNRVLTEMMDELPKMKAADKGAASPRTHAARTANELQR